MRIAIELDDEARLGTAEVHHIAADLMLASELVPS